MNVCNDFISVSVHVWIMNKCIFHHCFLKSKCTFSLILYFSLISIFKETLVFCYIFCDFFTLTLSTFVYGLNNQTVPKTKGFAFYYTHPGTLYFTSNFKTWELISSESPKPNNISDHIFLHIRYQSHFFLVLPSTLAAQKPSASFPSKNWFVSI